MVDSTTEKLQESQIESETSEIEEIKGAEIYSFVEQKMAAELRYNTLSMEVEYLKEKLLADTVREFCVDTFRVYASSKDKLWDSIYYFANLNKYSPVQEYLESLNVEPANIDDLATRYLGNDDSLANLLVKKMLIGAVSRALEPGCQMDSILILYGKQGIRKSTFFKVLAGDWFDDSVQKLNGGKDEIMKLHSCWIQELAEAEKILSQIDLGKIKSQITKTTDKYRPPYGKDVSDVPRAFILVGSTNTYNLLKDRTGNRRAWIVEVKTAPINTERLKEERDAIWAAAVREYRNGEKPYLDEADEKANDLNNAKYTIENTWVGAIYDYWQKNQITEYFTVRGIAENALGIKKTTGKDEQKIREALQELGFTRKRPRVNGDRITAYYPPEEVSS